MDGKGITEKTRRKCYHRKEPNLERLRREETADLLTEEVQWHSDLLD
jgi:hypothetical protein